MVTERRERQRCNAKGLIVLTSKGVAQVVNISTKGIYIKFANIVNFPNNSVIDIYDITGFSMVELHAKKVWGKILVGIDRYSYKPFKSEVFAEFETLSLSQECQLVFYLSQEKD